MKNAMKKLMSLVLVAMILVSAVPFAASADTAGAVTVVVIDNATDGEVARFEKTPTDTSAKVDNLLQWWVKNTADVESASMLNAYAYYADGSKGDIEADGDLVGGDRVRIRADITWKQAEQPTPDPDPTPDPVPEQKPVEVAPIKVVVKVGSSDNVVWSGEKAPANDEYATVENLLSYCFNSSWDGVYTFDHAWSSAQQANVSLSAKIYAGDTLSVMLKEKKATSTTPTVDKDEDEDEDELTDYTKFHEDVWLYIYADTTVGTVKKSLKITDGIAADGKVTMNEVKSVVKYYFNAVDSDTGITYDGLYPVQGNWVADYVIDKKYDTIDGLYEAAANQTVIIRVMVGNAKLASTSSNADSSNPKTGDEIYMAITAMAVSASALALGFYFTKKRAI